MCSVLLLLTGSLFTKEREKLDITLDSAVFVCRDKEMSGMFESHN